MNDLKTFAKVRQGLKELRENNQLINAVLVTDDGCQFRVHWELLAALSPPISQKVESLPALHVDASPLKISISHVTGDTMATIINWAYEGVLNVCLGKVDSLTRAACALQIPCIVMMCIQFLYDHLNEDTCVMIYQLSNQFQWKQLTQKSRKFILTHFEKVALISFNFLSLGLEDLQDFISSDQLNARNEEITFSAVMRWIEHDPQRRQQHLSQLLSLIRFGFCPITFFENNIVTNQMVTENQACQSVLYEASTLLSRMMNVPEEAVSLDARHLFTRPRIPDEIIFVIGGWRSGCPINAFETYDIRSNRWFDLPYADSMPRAYHGIISLDGLIYIIGGFDGYQYFNSVRCFDPVTHEWSEKACMYYARCYVSVASVNGIIYALGGYDGHFRHNSAECYNPITNQWKMVAGMCEIRSDASSAALDGKIYVVGGFNGLEVLRTAEVYDPEKDVWTFISEMYHSRTGVRLTTYNNTIYVMGGFDENNRLDTVERYDFTFNRWMTVASMNTSRSNLAAVVIEGFLFVIGGYNGGVTVPSVECYNHEDNTWVTVADMNVNRSGISACVVKGLPNGQEYTYIGNSAV